MAGNRTELNEFADECYQRSKVHIGMSMAQLNLHFPSHSFFEVLYNRIANDLCLWEPRSPLIKGALKQPADSSIQFVPFSKCKNRASYFKIQPKNSLTKLWIGNERNDSLDDSDRMSNLTINSGKRESKNNLLNYPNSHLFTLDFRVDKACVLLQTFVDKVAQIC